MITATRKVSPEDVTELMLLREETKWKRRTTEYVTYYNTMTALTAIITDSCPDIFYKVLHDPDLGYANRTPREFVVHFWNTYARDEDPDMGANLERMMVQWQPPTMLEALFTQLDVGQKFAAHHDAILDKTILRMAIENIQKSGMLDIALRDWALQTTESSWSDFTFYMYKAEKYRRDTAETTGSAGFLANFHGITPEDASPPPSLTTASTSDISELASALSSAADAQTAQITALMAAMMDQRLPESNSSARRNNPRKENDKRGKKMEKPKSYCWSHGVTRNMDQNSGTCDNQHMGKQSDATLDNRMGGLDRICGYRRNYSAPEPAN